MNPWKIPTSLSVGGGEYSIRTDFRDVLAILKYFASPDYEEDEKWMICMRILYLDWRSIPPECMNEAARQATAFIDAGIKGDGKPKPTTMDWEHDAPIIIPAVNRVLNTEIRSAPYLHWWTFLAAYMEIGKSLFSSVLSTRQKLAKGKKLEKEEKEFLKENKALILLPGQKKERPEEEKEALRKLLGR